MASLTSRSPSFALLYCLDTPPHGRPHPVPINKLENRSREDFLRTRSGDKSERSTRASEAFSVSGNRRVMTTKTVTRPVQDSKSIPEVPYSRGSTRQIFHIAEVPRSTGSWRKARARDPVNARAQDLEGADQRSRVGAKRRANRERMFPTCWTSGERCLASR